MLDAAKFAVPQSGLPGGIQNVTWKSNFSTDTAGISLQWQWGAALYTSFSTDYNAVGVKPVDDNQASQYQNSDHAGTPENLKGYVTGGTTGGGGSNFTGGLSGTSSTTVMVNQIPTANAGGPYSGVVGQSISFSGAGSSDADGDQLTYSWTFGDGTTATGVSPGHTYLTDGTFAVTLTVNDGRNDTGTASTTASIIRSATPSPPAITAQISPLPNSKGWNNTPATVSFTCSSSSSTIASCTSPITVGTQGVSQMVTGTATDKAGNSTTISVPLNIDLTPPTISAQVSVPSFNGWNNTSVTVSFQCSDGLSGVAQCPGPQTVSTEGTNQTISGTATDVAGNTASTSIPLKIDSTPPVITITSPTDGTVVTSSNLIVSGTVSDNLSGAADVACNGLDATITGSNTSCNLTLTVGANVIQVQATDVAGNTSATTVNVTYNLSPPPTALFLTPDHLAMAFSESRKVALVDNLARAIPASSWTVSDPTVAQIALDGTITPLAAGVVTITASYQSLSATAQLTVYGSQTFPPSTVRWSVQPLPGNTLLEVFPGQATGPDDPDVYFAEQAGSNIVMRALTSDGRQKWTHTIVPAIGTTGVNTIGSMTPLLRNTSAKAMGSGSIRSHRWGKKITKLLNEASGAQGPSVTSSVYSIPLQPAVFKRAASAFLTDARQQRGHLKRVQSGSSVRQIVLSSASTDSGNRVINIFERLNFGGCSTNCQDDIIVLDGNGNELWRHTIVGGEMGYALHPSGIVYILQADYNNNSTFTLFAFDEFTGAQKFSIVLPFSYGGQLQPFPGLPSVLPDGNLYLPVETVADSTSPDVLQLLKVAPDGTYSWFPVATAAQPNGPWIFPNEAIPDGQGGLLVTWVYEGRSGTGPAPVEATRMSSSDQILGQYALPLTRPRLGSYFSDNDGDAVLGAQHLFVIDDRGQSAVGLNLSTSTIDLNWQPPGGPCATFPCPQVSLAGVAPGDQLLVDQTRNSDGSSTLFAITPSSSPCSTTCCTATSSVPNSTLVAFDFSGTVFSPALGTSVSANQYFFGLPASSGPSGALGLGGAITAPDTTAVPEPDPLPPWPQLATRAKRESVKFEIAHFIPVGKTALGIDPQTAINQITQSLPKTVAIQHPFLGSAATVQAFLDTLAQAKPLSAIGFIGHSLDDSTVVNNQIEFYSVGLTFANQALVAPPNDDPQFPVRKYANTFVTPQIKTQAEIVFIGACFIGPPFKALWNIQDNTAGQALIVPKLPAGSQTSNEVILGHAVVAWAHLLDDLVIQHMNVGAAVKDTNSYLLTLPGVTEQWQVVGDSNVKINRK